jgi:gamma-carbonic anhydrase
LSTGDPRILSHHGVTPVLGPGVFVADTARVIGDVSVGADSSIWFGSVVRGDVFHVRLGERVNVQDGSVLHVTTGRHACVVEDDVTVGHRAVLHGCTVRRGALIGIGAIVMDGAEVGQEALVGAGALVPPGMVVEPRTLVMGAPARVRRDVSAEELAWLRGSSGRYVALARSYREEEGT